MRSKHIFSKAERLRLFPKTHVPSYVKCDPFVNRNPEKFSTENESHQTLRPQGRKENGMGKAKISKKDGNAMPPLCCAITLDNDSWFAKVFILHSDSAASLTHVFHCCQLALAHMRCIRRRSAAEAALRFVTARVT
jgi:hypothetical protein